jgi:hypothetical protein
MSNRNGMGPEEKGPKTGRGLGPCGDGNVQRNTKGRGMGMGLRRGIGLRQNIDADSENKNESA